MSERLPKRLRRDVRRCHECRRRKVKCQLASEAVDVCAECVRTGATCSRDPPDEVHAPAKDQTEDKELTMSCLNRLERIEQVLQEVLQAPPVGSNACSLPSNFSLPPDSHHHWSYPNTILHQELSIPDNCTSPKPNNAEIGGLTELRGHHSIEQNLISLLPTTEDAQMICSATLAWMLELSQPPAQIWRSAEHLDVRSPTSAIGSGQLEISKILLYFSLCLQQLPPDFETSQLSIQCVEGTVRENLRTITSLVLSNDEAVSSISGIECLLLLGMIHINKFDLKQAWFVFRRALDTCRILGFHESFRLPQQQTNAHHRQLWLSSAMGECYCSVLLGYGSSCGSYPFGHVEWVETCTDIDVSVRLCLIAIQWSQHIESGRKEVLEVATELNKLLDGLQDLLPPRWWQTPSLRQDRSMPAADEYERLSRQSWFLQIRLLVNLYALAQSRVGAGLEKFRDHALEASRMTLQLYQSMRQVRNSQLHCRVLDIAAYIAATAILLIKLFNNEHKKLCSDMRLAEQAIQSLNVLGQSSPMEKVAKQAAEVLITLNSALSGNKDCEAMLPETLFPFRLDSNTEIPHCTTPSSSSNGAHSVLHQVFRKAFVNDDKVTEIINQALVSPRLPSIEGPMQQEEVSVLLDLLNENAFG